MSTNTNPLLAAVTIAVFVLVVFAPGALTGYAVGLRGWVLAGFAPLCSYGIGGIAGPWLTTLGIPFNVVTLGVCTVLIAAGAFGLRWLALRRSSRRGTGTGSPGDGTNDTGPTGTDSARLWDRRGHLAVLVCLLGAAIIGAGTVLNGLGHIDAVTQGFDAVYHANGIRYIAETGDASLTGAGQPNWYAETGGLFYPNAYHLLAAIVYQLTGATIPSVLNIATMLLPGLLALSLVALVREFRGRAVLAGMSALVALTPTIVLYQSMARGPLLPYLLGLALTPLSAVALHRYLRRPAADTGFVFVAAGVALLCVHSSTLFGAILFALPVMFQRWARAARRRWRTIGVDLLALVPIAVASFLVAWLQLFGALGLANSGIPYWGWDNHSKVSSAVGNLLSFQYAIPNPQLRLCLALLLGVVFFARLDRLRWIGCTAVLSGVFFVAVAASDSELMLALSRPWWNDPVRFVAMATLPLLLIAAHGLAETQAWLREQLRGLRMFAAKPSARTWLGAGTAIAVLAAFVSSPNPLYTSTNSRIVAGGYGNQPGADPHRLAVSPDEVQAMHELGKRAKPGEWAMNDRYDGTSWTYALSGVRTVAGHFDPALAPRVAGLLAHDFREYPTNPRVRAAVRELNIRWVIVGQFGHPKTAPRQEGLRGLDRLPFLRLVYRNADAAVYRITG